MDANNTNPASYGRQAVSRRAAPHSTGSFNVGDNSNSSVGVGHPPPPAHPGHGNKAKAKSNKKKEDYDKYDVEARPLLFGSDHGSGGGGGGPHHTNSHSSASKAGSSSSAGTSSATSQGQTAKFVDSWMGAMLKVKAKQAGKHVYNLRAKMASKKGFHVQMPKRMLFYTGLIFLVLPLMLFFREEKHIHHNAGDLTHHDAKEHHEHDHHIHEDVTGQGGGQHHPRDATYQLQKDYLRRHPKKKKVTKESLHQLLLGGAVNATSPSNSRKENSKTTTKTARQDPEGNTEGSLLLGAAASPNATGTLAIDTQQQQQQQQIGGDGDTKSILEQKKQENEQSDEDLEKFELAQKSKEFLPGEAPVDKGDTTNNGAPDTDENNNVTNDHITHDEERR